MIQTTNEIICLQVRWNDFAYVIVSLHSHLHLLGVLKLQVHKARRQRDMIAIIFTCATHDSLNESNAR